MPTSIFFFYQHFLRLLLTKLPASSSFERNKHIMYHLLPYGTFNIMYHILPYTEYHVDETNYCAYQRICRLLTSHTFKFEKLRNPMPKTKTTNVLMVEHCIPLPSSLTCADVTSPLGLGQINPKKGPKRWSQETPHGRRKKGSDRGGH
jgi:hypothetical protein